MTWQPIETIPRHEWVWIKTVSGIEAEGRVNSGHNKFHIGRNGNVVISCERRGKACDVKAEFWKPLSSETVTPSVKTMASLPTDLHLPSLLRSSISLALCMGMVSQETHDNLYKELRGK